MKPGGRKKPSPTSAPPTPGPILLGIGSKEVNAVDGAVMVYVPAGEFLMGSEDGGSDESPQHTVYLDAFWIYQHEVTNEQYAAFLNTMGNQTEGGVSWLNAGNEDVLISQQAGAWAAKDGYGDHPVIEVSWTGAQAYCEWAGGGLPTEAEWEKAARGTDGRTYPWGEEAPDCSLAQYWGCSGKTVQVGSFPQGASPYGALDMAGNVWEWVADGYDAAYYVASPYENPNGPESGYSRVLRGGPWLNSGWLLRSSNRVEDLPGGTVSYYGFRCRRSP